MNVTVTGNLATIAFDRFDLEQYRLFLQTKQLPESQVTYDWEVDRYEVTTPARFAALLGVAGSTRVADRLDPAPHLFDYQRWTVAQALDAKRFAAWLDTGLGKTAVYLEWARQVRQLTGARVLILTPLGIIPQVIEEAQRFYGDDLVIERLTTRQALDKQSVASSVLTGRQAEVQRADILDRFRSGEIEVLISKPVLLGFGLNFQFVNAMVFSGFDDSFERMYQAIRRAYRFGQTETVHVDIPYIPELEGVVFDNIRSKEARFLEEVAAQELAYQAAVEDLAA